MTSPTETETAAPKATVTVTIDGHEIEAYPDELLIAAAERTGTYIPRFCYHPRMKPVGMCRQCLVNVEGPRGTSLQVSCMLTCSDGMKVDTKSDTVKKAQDGVLEFLLVNHPLDCPVCDKGGECPLQDQTLAFGPGETRYVEEKRHYEKPIQISPLVDLDRERCVLCDRCTRFSKDVAGDPLIHFQQRGNNTEVNTFPEHPFSSYFSGNTVQICPVGALTANPYRFKARPWDLEQVESTCTSCSVGCRVAVQSSADQVTRYLGLDAEPTNHGWMCDKGRFDFEALNSERRLSKPLIAGESGSWADALDRVSHAIKESKPERIAILGGARLPNEDQYAWSKLARAVIGTDNVDAQLADGLPAETVLGTKRATIDEACSADAVVLIAPDLKEELPVLFLRLREAAVDKGVPFIEISPQPTSFTSLAKVHIGYRAGDAAAVGEALTSTSAEVAGVEESTLKQARAILKSAEKVVVVFGRQSMADNGRGIVDTVTTLAKSKKTKFLPALRRSNVMGALDMGLTPGMLPGRVSVDDAHGWYQDKWGSVPSKKGLDATGIMRAAANGDIDVLVLLGADPLHDFPDRELAERAFDNVKTIVSLDVLPNESNARAHVVLPSAGYAERSGTTTNIEGRVTKLGQKVTAPGVAWPEWTIASALADMLDVSLGLDSLETIQAEIAGVAPSHQGLTAAVIDAKENRDGVVLPLGAPAVGVPPLVGLGSDEAAPLSPVDGYAVRLVAGRQLYDQGTLTQNSPHLAGLVKATSARVHPSALAPLGVVDGGEVRIKNQRAEALINVVGDESVPRGAIVIPFNVSNDVSPSAFIDVDQPVTNVRIETP